MLKKLKFDHRRIAQAREAFEINIEETQGDLVQMNHYIGAPSLTYSEVMIKLFLKTTAKVVLIMPYLVNSVGIATFFILSCLVSALAFFKVRLLIQASKNEGYYNYGLLLRTSFRSKEFVLLTIVECLSYLVEYGLIIIQINQIVQIGEIFKEYSKEVAFLVTIIMCRIQS